jgi:dienelactone hydrolase
MCTGACAHGQPAKDALSASAGESPGTPAESAAAELLGFLARRDWASAEARFSPNMVRAMPEAHLAQLWERLLATQGDWVRIDRYATEKSGPFAIAVLDLRFTRRRVRLRMTVGSDGKIEGLFHAPVPEDLEQEAREVVEALASGDGARATREFDDVMRKKLPAATAVEDWRNALARTGAFAGVAGVKVDQNARIALVDCRTGGRGMVVRIVFNADGDVSGLFFQAAYEPPNYVDPSAIVERDLSVGSAPSLPGTLTLPKNARAVAGAVLVHGSGPNDRDENLGATAVFRDLALGLATRGVAVLRYDKRTRVDRRGVVTQKEEVVDGALAAVNALRQQPEVDPARVVVIGHSQGGALAPRIAEEDGRLAGVLVLAGPTRPLQDSSLAQAEYLSSLDPSDEMRQKGLEQARAFKKVVDDPGLKSDSELPGGTAWRGAYFLAMRGYHPEQVAAKLECPILVVQGERDYQVTLAEDFPPWRQALAGNPRATLKTYPALDHRLVAGVGRSAPEQYEIPSHVDAQLVSDLAAWITDLKAAPSDRHGPGGATMSSGATP